MSNVLLFVSDEHNPFFSSVFGHPFIHTPNMERLARQGTVCRHAYCPSPLCLPSRSAFMAGRRAHELQTYSNCTAELNPDCPSYGEVLAGQGVHTAYIGKTDVYAPGKKLGFTEMLLPGDRDWPGDTQIRRHPLHIRKGAEKRANGYGPAKDTRQGDNQCVERAAAWLKDTAPKLKKPWVLTVNVGAPHFPHYTTPELWNLYPQGGDLPACNLENETAWHPFAEDLRTHFQTHLFTETQIRGLRRGYLGCVTYVDGQLGRLMETLESAGLAGTTNVIYTSDHGEMCGKFGMWWKCSLYEDSARVPLIAAGPDFASGKEVQTPVDLHDARAAVFRCLKAKHPKDWVGTPLQKIPDNDNRRAVFSEYHGHGARASSYMIRQGRWKYIRYCGAPDQLFDLRKDPDELHNCIENHPNIARRLHRELLRVCDPDKENDRAEEFIQKQLRAIRQKSRAK